MPESMTPELYRYNFSAMNPLSALLASQPLILLDGALATELERRGADLRDPLWSAKILLEQPELIQQVHLDYFRAGADCAITASYQASVPGFTRRGLSGAEALVLIGKSVALARAARDQYWDETASRGTRPRLFIAGSVGPYGATLHDGSEYRGDYPLSEEELIAFHRPRLAALVAAGADLMACETIPSLHEARALVRLLVEFPDAAAWVSFSARDGLHTSHGEPLRACAEFLDACPQVAAVGINCTPPKFIPSLINAVREGTRKPILVYPNSGELWDAASQRWYGETACDDFAEQARDWYAAGARLIGGCCRTTPEHIRGLREVVTLSETKGL